MASYAEVKYDQQKTFDSFPMMFAFSNEQFNNGMKKLDVTSENELYSIGGGGYIRKTDSKAFSEMIDNLDSEMLKLIEADITGEGFVYDMFRYELDNHEYCITYDLTDTLNALGYTMEEINSKDNLRNGLKKALRKYR